MHELKCNIDKWILTAHWPITCQEGSRGKNDQLLSSLVSTQIATDMTSGRGTHIPQEWTQFTSSKCSWYLKFVCFFLIINPK